MENNASGFEDLIKWLKQLTIDVSKLIIVMEHTGLYSYQFEQFLHRHQVSFTKISGLAIKRSMGLVRGKCDKKDAVRIAQYGFEKADRLTPDKPISNRLQRLQMLHSTRERLVKNRAGFIVAVQEYQEAYGLTKTDIIIAPQLKLIKTLDQQIEKLDNAIQGIIEDEKAVRDNYHLLQSIP